MKKKNQTCCYHPAGNLPENIFLNVHKIVKEFTFDFFSLKVTESNNWENQKIEVLHCGWIVTIHILSCICRRLKRHSTLFVFYCVEKSSALTLGLGRVIGHHAVDWLVLSCHLSARLGDWQLLEFQPRHQHLFRLRCQRFRKLFCSSLQSRNPPHGRKTWGAPVISNRVGLNSFITVALVGGSGKKCPIYFFFLFSGQMRRLLLAGCT